MFDHERLHVYQASLQFVAWVFERAERLKGLFRHSRDELIRASQSIPRNIAEGNGKRALTDLMLKSAAMVKNPITILEHAHEHE